MEQLLNTVLLYSLGFGLVLALLTGLTLAMTRSSSPLLRYRILVALLGLFTIGIAITGYIKLAASYALASGTISISDQTTTPAVQQIALAPTTTGNLIAIAGDFMTNNARTIALIWVFVVLFKCIKLGSNLFELHYLKTREVYPAGKHWEDEVARLSQKIGLNKAVKVLQSGLTQVPLVIGHLKPVILIPLGMITAIKPREIEMMLLHELAHIKRLDFLVNILQHVLELLFFFNPAVLWISTLIRKERENCCDEMVLQVSMEKHSYIQALLSFQEYQLNVPAYAMAFAKESNLIRRVKRMVYQKNTALSSLEKGCLLLAVMILCSFSVLHSTRAADHKTVRFQDPVVKKKKSTEKTVPLPPTAPIQPPAPPKTKSILAPAKPPVPAPPAAPKVPISNNDRSTISNAGDSSLHYSSSVQLYSFPKLTTQVQLNTQSNFKTRLDLNPPTNQVTYSKIIVKTPSLSEELISALENAGISTKGENFKFRLTNNELSINGQKQPEEILHAILKEFIKSPEDTIDFNYNRTSKGVDTSSSYYRK
ncbi:MAG: M56 family metallopeptidase [Bacteroidota bacterium]